VLRRGADGNWPDMASIVRPPDTLALHSLDFTVPVAELYRAAGLTA